MKKSSERGRGKGRGVSPDVSRRGRSVAPNKTHSIPPMLSRKSTLTNPKEQDDIINWMTTHSQASSSGLSSTSTSRTRSESSASYKEPAVGTKRTQPAATPGRQLPNNQSEEFLQDAMGYSQELFPPQQTSTRQRSMEQPEILCLDSQPFTGVNAPRSEMQGGSEEDDTQIPEQDAQELYQKDLEDVGVSCAEVILGSSTPRRTPTYEEFVEMEEEGVLDNVDADPDYVCEVEPRRRNSSTTDESAGEPTAARVRLVPESRRGSSDTTSVEGRRKRGTTNRKTTQHSRCSKVWPFFQDCSEDCTMVICKVCRTRLSRGQNIRNLSTTSMRRHMESKHPTVWSNATGQGTSNTASLGVTRLTTRPSSAAAAVGQPLRGSQQHSQTSDDADTVTFPNSAQEEVSQASTNTTTNSPSVCSRTVQLSVTQMFERKRKLPANDPRAVALTASIAKFVACEMLPYRVVETNSFKGMMSVAIPRYVVPSRYHFARCAVPELHEHVVSRITRSLKNAVACKVHLTTDTWTSAFGQGRYISLTAHWVNLVEPGSDSSPATARVLPTPQTAAPPSLPVPLDNSSTYLSDSFSSNTSQSCTSSGNANPAAIASWKQCSTAVGMRQQALLKLICLGDKQHTGEEIWRGIKEQTDLWLAPLDLKPGMVVCDNGSNLIRALRLANLTHIPCLAHVMNLVVQRFLRTYPGVADLLSKVRRVVKHCRKSSTASEGLAKMQERFHLPRHRLLCDVPTRWNSTLHMLARFCEQKSAVVQYMTAQYRGASGQLPSFCGSDWATMFELCQVLQNFEETTLLVSSDNSSVSITIPLLCLLKRSMLKIKETAVMMQVGESEGDNNQHHTNIRQSASGNAGPSSYDEEEEEEEQLELEQDFDAPTAEGQSGARWTSTMQREWSAEADEEEGDAYGASQLSQRSEEDEEDSGRTLAHMAQFMVECIERDPRIVRILDNKNYWVYTLLDPRYKHNVPKLLDDRVRQVKMEEYQQALVETLVRRLTSSPSSSQLYADRLTSANPGGPGGQQRTQAAASSQKGMVSAVSLEWENFLTQPMQQPTEQQAGSSTSSNTDRLEKMVKDYMSDGVAVLNNPSAPFNYWVSKLDTWHELAMYAIEVLACPAASVMSERCFSAAGGIVTDRRIRLSTENADRLTQIKMNQSWIGNDYGTLPDPPNQVT